MTEDILERYGQVLAEVDRWFRRCMSTHGRHIACGQGCSACCRGLFDITLLDALYLKNGFDRLPAEVRREVTGRGLQMLEGIDRCWPSFGQSRLLNGIPEEEWDEIMPEEDERPCVLLSAAGHCLAYDHRPMTCRLNGIPMIDTSGEALFDDWCTLNFIGVDPLDLPELRHDFNQLFAQELLLVRELALRLTGRRISEMDTLIPAVPFLEPSRVAAALTLDAGGP